MADYLRRKLKIPKNKAKQNPKNPNPTTTKQNQKSNKKPPKPFTKPQTNKKGNQKAVRPKRPEDSK